MKDYNHESNDGMESIGVSPDEHLAFSKLVFNMLMKTSSASQVCSILEIAIDDNPLLKRMVCFMAATDLGRTFTNAAEHMEEVMKVINPEDKGGAPCHS